MNSTVKLEKIAHQSINPSIADLPSIQPEMAKVLEITQKNNSSVTPREINEHLACILKDYDELTALFAKTNRRIDEELVGNVIGNAFSNAVRYTKDRVRLSARVEDGMLEIRIEDNGRGYTEEMLEQGRMASRPVDFDGGSTGLGLYFSSVIAQLHRNRGRAGQIRLENGGAFGGGCFILTLP